MMNIAQQFFNLIHKNATLTLATESEHRLTMRLISPVLYEGGILFFTHSTSLKYQQLQKNPHCCIGTETFFAEAIAQFQGKTLDEKNENLRKAYCEKFPGAFDQGVEFGGREAEFIWLKPHTLRGWTFPEGAPTEKSQSLIPSVPFEINL